MDYYYYLIFVILQYRSKSITSKDHKLTVASKTSWFNFNKLIIIIIIRGLIIINLDPISHGRERKRYWPLLLALCWDHKLTVNQDRLRNTSQSTLKARNHVDPDELHYIILFQHEMHACININICNIQSVPFVFPHHWFYLIHLWTNSSKSQIENLNSISRIPLIPTPLLSQIYGYNMNSIQCDHDLNK